jgi:hypothetical protein
MKTYPNGLLLFKAILETHGKDVQADILDRWHAVHIRDTRISFAPFVEANYPEVYAAAAAYLRITG